LNNKYFHEDFPMSEIYAIQHDRALPWYRHDGRGDGTGAWDGSLPGAEKRMANVKQFLLAIVAAVGIAMGTPIASGGQPLGLPERVAICHKPGTPAQKTLTLPRKVAEKLIATHGDTLGACEVARQLAPEVACIIQMDEMHFRAFFGYSNATEFNITISVGGQNRFMPGPADQGQPEVFAPGQTPIAFSVPFDGSSLAWQLGSGVAVASRATPPCADSNPVDLTSGPTIDKGAGPAVVSEDDVRAFKPPPSVDIPAAQEPGDQVQVVPPIDAPGGADGTTSGPEDQPLPQSELPKVSARAVGDFASTGFPADAQIAASRTHIIVSGARAIA
jgi:hypothetical protein